MNLVCHPAQCRLHFYAEYNLITSRAVSELKPQFSELLDLE